MKARKRTPTKIETPANDNTRVEKSCATTQNQSIQQQQNTRINHYRNNGKQHQTVAL